MGHPEHFNCQHWANSGEAPLKNLHTRRINERSGWQRTVRAGVRKTFKNLINSAEINRTDDETLFVLEGLFTRHLLRGSSMFTEESVVVYPRQQLSKSRGCEVTPRMRKFLEEEVPGPKNPLPRISW